MSQLPSCSTNIVVFLEPEIRFQSIMSAQLSFEIPRMYITRIVSHVVFLPFVACFKFAFVAIVDQTNGMNEWNDVIVVCR